MAISPAGITLALAVVTGVVPNAAAEDSFVHFERGGGYRVASGGESGSCETLFMNSEGEYESAYAWQYEGVVPPDYGAWAECYFGAHEICGLVLDLSDANHDGPNDPLDAYVWDSQEGAPGAVLCMQVAVDPGIIASWPYFSRHTFQFSESCQTAASWWVGFWPNWPGEVATWMLAADLDGPGGCPYTKYAPGLGYATGWHSVTLLWGATQAMGIGAEVKEIPTPIRETTWGAIKAFYAGHEW